MCGITVRHSGGRVEKISGNPDDPFSRGYHCIKAESLADLYADPDRLRAPVRRTPSGFETISWDRAIALAAEGLDGVKAKAGSQG